MIYVREKLYGGRLDLKGGPGHSGMFNASLCVVMYEI